MHKEVLGENAHCCIIYDHEKTEKIIKCDQAIND